MNFTRTSVSIEDMEPPTPEDLERTDRAGAIRRLLAELWCLGLAFRFHDDNNHLRKAVTLMVLFVWVTLELGNAYGLATLPEGFLYLRAFVGLLLGRMWNIEIQQFAGLTTGSQPPDDEDSDDTTE